MRNNAHTYGYDYQVEDRKIDFHGQDPFKMALNSQTVGSM